jgi:hypothetical protein
VGTIVAIGVSGNNFSRDFCARASVCPGGV